MKELKLSRGRALVVVAHPDDETIWMGGTILGHPAIAWTIFVLCRKNDKERYPKFLRATKLYNAQGIMSDLKDSGILTLKESLPETEKRIRRNLKNKKFDYIFTHGSNGEYGHINHKGVHLVIKKLFQEKKLTGSNLFFFSYFRPRAEFCFKLSEKEFKMKKDIIKNVYGFSEDSFENKNCKEMETFDKYHL